MLADRKAFSGCAVDDIAKAQEFYGQTLGVRVEVLDETVRLDRRDVVRPLVVPTVDGDEHAGAPRDRARVAREHENRAEHRPDARRRAHGEGQSQKP